MNDQNKIYVVEYKGDNALGGTSYFVIVIAASSILIAREHVKEQIGIDVQPVWLMNATYPIIYVSDGSIPKKIQAKILYNGNCHFF